MKKLLIFILFFCLFINKVSAESYITYSDWQEEYPYWLDEMFIESEDRYLWYREVLNSETNEIEREETEEYYKELDGYIRIEESKKTFYRYITNDRVLIDGHGNLVYNINYCIKNYCSRVALPKKPEGSPNEIENPKTYDNIFVFMILGFISFVSIILSVNTIQIKKAY